MEFNNSRFSVIKTPSENLKPTSLKKAPQRLRDPYSIQYDNLKYEYVEDKIHVSVDGIMKGMTKNSGTVKVNQNYGTNPLQSAIVIAQNQAEGKLHKAQPVSAHT